MFFSSVFSRHLGNPETVRGVSAFQVCGLRPGKCRICPEKMARGPTESPWQVGKECLQLQQVEGAGPWAPGEEAGRDGRPEDNCGPEKRGRMAWVYLRVLPPLFF